jgi:hypothetical protein
VFTKAVGRVRAVCRGIEAARRPGFKISDEGWKFGLERRRVRLTRADFAWKFAPAQMASALRVFIDAPPTQLK